MHPVTEAIHTLSNVLNDPEVRLSEAEREELFEAMGTLIYHEPDED